MTPEIEGLRSVRTFPSLVKYLREQLDWPIDSDDVDELTFDYEPEEIGLDPKTAAKVRSIKQIRPFPGEEVWGIFYVDFEPKRLPVVALRRILQALVIKKRQASSKSQMKTWGLHDLLFINSYGEGDERAITFAHFKDEESNTLPTLKVVGWDAQDTPLHMDQCAEELGKLRYDEGRSPEEWRKDWSSAFTLGHREVITTSKALAERMADLAIRIRKRVNAVLKIESENGPIRKLHKAFQQTLIHDLSEDDFADMYAQTITYGLFSARCSRPEDLVAENLADMIPVTNPFLKELLATFLTIGGRKGKIDFDELGINDVVEMLRDANIEAVKRDFDDKNPQHDPVIHFYEDFLKQYDAQKKVKRGVFYTPKPVVSFIVRSVHELLQKEFGLEDGLADTTTWGQMLRKHPEMKLPTINVKNPKTLKMEDVPISENEPFVQILDPAVGTGTFLVEVIDIIKKTMYKKWEKQGHLPLEFVKLWNQYVPRHLLPRLYGFELMMAPYAIAHMKIGLKLFETGYQFGADERARIYLTNSLEPPQDFSDRFEFDAPALAHEAKAVNIIKRNQRFTVIVGNPPYSIQSANLTETARELIEVYKYVDGQRIKERNALQFEKNLQDDYVKFIRLAEIYINASRTGVVGYISNDSYLDSRTFRGMRQHLISSFSSVSILDLHGSQKKSETDEKGSRDENVFDIQQGVSISIMHNSGLFNEHATVRRTDLIGTRVEKYAFLVNSSFLTVTWIQLIPTSPFYLFAIVDSNKEAEYTSMSSLRDIVKKFSSGMKTHKDRFAYAFTKNEMRKRLDVFVDPKIPEEFLRTEYALKDTPLWKLSVARKKLMKKDFEVPVIAALYRPFDFRAIVYSDEIVRYTARPIMQHLDGQRNLALLVSQQQITEGFAHVFVTRVPADWGSVSNRSRESTSVFPLYLNLSNHSEQSKELFVESGIQNNIKTEFLKHVADQLGLSQFESLQFLGYVYSVLHSPNYRSRYASFLKSDFPRIPLTRNVELFRALAKLGGELVSLHLMESDKLNKHITKWLGQTPSSEVEKVIWSDDTVWINKSKTEGFKGVTENVWNFHIGGYQVCEKWLKDRKGRKLSKEDIEHYQKVVVALNETIRIMKSIDEVIDVHGGWPNAFTMKK